MKPLVKIGIGVAAVATIAAIIFMAKKKKSFVDDDDTAAEEPQDTVTPNEQGEPQESKQTAYEYYVAAMKTKGSDSLSETGFNEIYAKWMMQQPVGSNYTAYQFVDYLVTGTQPAQSDVNKELGIEEYPVVGYPPPPPPPSPPSGQQTVVVTPPAPKQEAPQQIFVIEDIKTISQQTVATPTGTKTVSVVSIPTSSGQITVSDPSNSLSITDVQLGAISSDQVVAVNNTPVASQTFSFQML